MNTRGIFSNKRFVLALTATLIFGIVFFVVTVFVIGGDEFIIDLTNYIATPLAFISAWLAFTLWSLLRKDKNASRIWLGVSMGLALWTLAELVWLFYTLKGISTPFPSLADLFWVGGYIPLLIGLIIRYRSLRATPTKEQKRVVLIFTVALSVITLFLILAPIFQEFSLLRTVEIILNILYPGVDLALFVVVLLLLLVYKGDLNIPWRIIILGFILRIIGDVLFSYTTWLGSYYPNDDVNLISAITDFSYIFSYPLLSLGFFVHYILFKQQKEIPIPLIRKITPAINTNVLVCTDKESVVISLSENFYKLFKASDKNVLLGKPLYAVLGITEENLSILHREIINRKLLINWPIKADDAKQLSHNVMLTAVAIYYNQNEYSGANILLRTHLEEENPDKEVSQETKRMMDYILNEVGLREKELKRQILDYMIAVIEKFHNLAMQYGGSNIDKQMKNLFNEVSESNGWRIRLEENSIKMQEEYDISELKTILPVLLQKVKTYLSDIASSEVVNQELDTLDRQVSDGVLEIFSRKE